MPFSGDPGLNGLKELFMYQGWPCLSKREILDNLSDIYTNLVYGNQTETDIAMEVAKIYDKLKEYWFE